MLNLRPQILGHTVLLSLYLLTCNAQPSYYITAPQYIISGESATLAVHWFGKQYSEINVTAGIQEGDTNILVQAYKIFSYVQPSLFTGLESNIQKSIADSTNILVQAYKLFSNESATLAVHWFGKQYSEVNVTAGIADSTNILVQAYKIFSNDSIGLLTIPAIPANSSSVNYQLLVAGCVNGTLVFKKQTHIEFQTKKMSMFIQTDKDNYRAGDIVHIRVVSVNHDLKPYTGNVDLQIKDPNSNIVQQWLQMKSDLGVVSTYFSLTSNPIPGLWTIEAKSKDNVFSTSFYIMDYALPPFFVTLNVPQVYLNTTMLNLTGTVTASYYSGKPIEGNVTITMKPAFPQNTSDVKYTYKISGSVNFSFPYTNIENALNLTGMLITASVTDQVTGISVEAPAFIKVSNSEYEINFIDQYLEYSPGKNYTTMIQIQRTDKKPLNEEDRKKNVTVQITYNGMTLQQEYVIPKTEIVTVEFSLNFSAIVTSVAFMVQYNNLTLNHSIEIYTNQLKSPSDVKVGIPFKVQVDVLDQVQQIYYTVLSKGRVVAAGKNGTLFSLMPENTWAPTADLLVYYFRRNDSIIKLSKTLNIIGTLNNKIGLSWSKTRANPLETVSLTAHVKESPSLVGLFIADKSSILNERLNDLTTRKVYQELSTYNMASPIDFTDANVNNPPLFFPRTEKMVEMYSRQNGPFVPLLWTWLETNISSGLESTIPLIVPDINTTWVATAFVISENLGLGIVEEPAELSIFKPFVVELNMPYSITRGEQFILQVNLKNSLMENLQVLVTLENNPAFNIIVPYNTITSNNEPSTPMVAGQQKVSVPSQGETTVLFPIEPKVLGNITLTVTATSKAASDVLTRSIVVKAEGVKYFFTQSELFSLSASGNASQIVSKNFSFSLPSDVVEDSEEAFITVVGDPLLPSINGLESLIQMPYGCGEQNMINFAPNIYILQYLITSKKITEDIKSRAIGFMNIGYQKELTYKRSDGSFSAFGNDDSSGSTWLSAFVFRCFLQARAFIYISPTVLDQIALWLVQFQNMTTGMFIEPGRVIHKELQGGMDGPVTLTAYILTSLLEDDNYRLRYDQNIKLAVQYIESNLDGISTNYTLSVVAYALSLAKSAKADAVLNKLNLMAITAGDLKFWSSPSTTANYYSRPRTADIETAAYALLAFNEQKRFSDAVPVLKWLTQQRSSLGGYGSTQDTIMALQALCKIFPAVDTSLTVSVTGSTVDIPKQFNITNDNLLLLQSEEIEVSTPLSVNVTVKGRGLAIVQFNVMYNRKPLSRRRRDTITEAFKLDVKVREKKNNFIEFSVDICTSYQGPGNESGMALIDVGFLSGFTMKTEDFSKPKSLKLVETKEDKVYFYLDSLTKDKFCISVPMLRLALVASSQDALIRVYDYYSPEMTATRTYNSLVMSQISSCDFCGSDCNLCRSNVPAAVTPQKNNAYRPGISMLWLFVLCYYM